jgi:hypothetical protein
MESILTSTSYVRIFERVAESIVLSEEQLQRAAPRVYG